MLMLTTSLWLAQNLFHHQALLTAEEKVFLVRKLAYDALKEDSQYR